ncbi:squalene--hopene cyclase [bacterium]|nr:squalene--hopene cyclase [bacterium]
MSTVNNTIDARAVTVSELTETEIQQAYDQVAERLLLEATPQGHWEGELSTSALSTATAVMTLSLLAQQEPTRAPALESSIEKGLQWLIDHQNEDGGWGDTVLSISNISTTMLAHSVLWLQRDDPRFTAAIEAAAAAITQAGGVAAVHRRYGKDRTFSAPILTQCALAGLVDWREVAALPFELAWLPHSFYKFVRLPVVSYALPALIAIGQIRHVQRPSFHPLLRGLRHLARKPTLRKLTEIQPGSGGFLEATPLTSFVCMSLIALGESQHPVVQKGIEFLLSSMRDNGGWPIDTNLATWVTTLAVNGLDRETLPATQRQAIARWLLGQQWRETHPYTQAAPGGWAWTDLPGGVPDADDTPGAILAVLNLTAETDLAADGLAAASSGIEWLLDLQNRDGGWPTFCRGWGALPFDRSSADITAHVLRAMHIWQNRMASAGHSIADKMPRINRAMQKGFAYLERMQRTDGSWLPLWFGNQHGRDDENPVYGTTRVLMAYRECQRLTVPSAQRGLQWLTDQQNADGGWGGSRGLTSTVEETALAVDALEMGDETLQPAQNGGLRWLIAQVNTGSIADPSPIGFYFAKLWYFERLYPLVFTASALRRALKRVRQTSTEPAFPDITARSHAWTSQKVTSDALD